MKVLEGVDMEDTYLNVLIALQQTHQYHLNRENQKTLPLRSGVEKVIYQYFLT